MLTGAGQGLLKHSRSAKTQTEVLTDTTNIHDVYVVEYFNVTLCPNYCQIGFLCVLFFLFRMQ